MLSALFSVVPLVRLLEVSVNFGNGGSSLFPDIVTDADQDERALVG